MRNVQADEAGSSAVDKGMEWKLVQSRPARCLLDWGWQPDSGRCQDFTNRDRGARAGGTVPQDRQHMRACGAGGGPHPIGIPRGPRHSVRGAGAGR